MLHHEVTLPREGSAPAEVPLTRCLVCAAPVPPERRSTETCSPACSAVVEDDGCPSCGDRLCYCEATDDMVMEVSRYGR